MKKHSALWPGSSGSPCPPEPCLARQAPDPGGLAFIAAANDHHFGAFRARTGKLLWDTRPEAGACSTPITRRGKNGKRDVVFVAAGGSYYDPSGVDRVAAYTLR